MRPAAVGTSTDIFAVGSAQLPFSRPWFGLPLLLTHPTHHPRYLVALSDPQDEGLVRWCALAFRVLSCHPECLDDETNGRILEALVRLCEVQVSECQPKIKI